MDINISNGFLQIITRATRVQGIHFSLIDLILTNSNHDSYTAGTLIFDISDHFINFIKLPQQKSKTKQKPTFKRNFSQTNVNNFKETLSNFNWAETLTKNDVDTAFNSFWSVFLDFYNLHFPLKKFKFNKNSHKINDFLTAGLLISRKNKLELCKKATKERTAEALLKYKTYRNIFNSLLRKSKKMYFDSNFKTH